MPDTGVAYASLFNGNSWQLINNGFIRNGAHLEAVLSLEANDSLVFAGTDDVGIFRSNDNGQQWKQIAGTNQYGDVYSIAIASSQVFYGTTYGGIYSSDDFGNTFSANNVGLRYKNTTLPFLVKDLLILGDTIYAATDLGVFKQGLLNINTATIEQHESEMRISVYPNPAKSNIIIECTFDLPATTNIILTNNLMNLNISLNNSTHNSGKQIIEYNTSGLADGLYFLQIKFPGKLYAQKIILMK
jgi:hypothetical protein